MRKFLLNVIATMLTLFLILSFAACGEPETTELVEDWEELYTVVLSGANIAPDAEVIASRQYEVEDIYADNTKTSEEKAALMMKYATYNETTALRYAYFNNTRGTTDLSDKSGTLIYQRTRRQNLNAKYDMTLKLPVNHNFDVIAQKFVSDSTIRLVSGGKYYRMSGNDAELDENGQLSASGWKKYSGKFNVDEDMSASQNYEDSQKSAINYDCVGIIADGALIELIESEAGNYYKLTFTIDTAVANADSATIDKLEQDNGGSNMSYNSFSAVVEIWTSGFFKSYTSDESWQGKISFYNGSASSRTVIYYSYTAADNDMAAGIAVKDGLL